MINALSYIGFTSPRADEWKTFGPDILGLELVEPGPVADDLRRVVVAQPHGAVQPRTLRRVRTDAVLRAAGKGER